MIIHLVRHAHAGNRSAWTGEDSQRPLSTKGRAQSEAIADSLAPLLIDAGTGPRGFSRSGGTELLSSPFLRCVQTLEPLAARLDLKVSQSAALGEGVGGSVALQTLLDTAGEVSALVACSHGDVIPAIVAAALGRGATLDGEVELRKAARFVIEVEDGAVKHLTHVARPEV